LLAHLSGEETRNIRLEKSDVSHVKNISSASSEVSADAFVQAP
jgi:hypothetical protein